MKAIARHFDIKSLIIGFLLAVVLMLTIGSSYGPQEVKIVGIDYGTTIPVKLVDAASGVEIPVLIKGTKYNDPLPVRIKN